MGKNSCGYDKHSCRTFTAYMFIVSDRETKISTTQSNIACEIINLDLRSGSRHHPSADIIYQGKKYDTVINKRDSLQLGFNNTTFFYDEKLDRVFVVILV